MFSEQFEGLLGTGALPFQSAKADSEKATDESTEHVT